MGLFSKLGQSTDLVEGMAERLGIDYADVIAKDPETQGPKFMRAVMSCSHCTNQDGCVKLQENCSELETAPGYCRNGELFDHMRGV